jgi:hypothetical protein
MENSVVMPLMMVMFDDVPGVLFFAAGPVRPAGSRGNDDTREEAAGKTRRVSSGACQIRLVFQAGGFSPAPSLVRAARHSNKEPSFPGSGSK